MFALSNSLNMYSLCESFISSKYLVSLQKVGKNKEMDVFLINWCSLLLRIHYLPDHNLDALYHIPIKNRTLKDRGAITEERSPTQEPRVPSLDDMSFRTGV